MLATLTACELEYDWFLNFFLSIGLAPATLHIEELIEDTISAELLAMISAGTGDGNSS
jgi:hypothetical protein